MSDRGYSEYRDNVEYDSRNKLPEKLLTDNQLSQKILDPHGTLTDAIGATVSSAARREAREKSSK